MLKFLCFSLFLYCSVSSLGQSQIQFDPLEKGIESFATNVDSSIYFFKLGLKQYKLEQNWTNYVQCLNALSTCYWLRGNIPESFKMAEYAYEFAYSNKDPGEEAQASALNNYAYYLEQKGDYEQAIKLYEEALNYELNKTEIIHKEVITLYNNMASCMIAEGDYYEAERILKKVINYSTLNKATNLSSSINSHMELSNVYENTSRTIDAIQKHESILLTISLNPDDKKTIRNGQIINLRLAHIHYKLNQEEKFWKHIKLAKHYSKLLFDMGLDEIETLTGDWYMKFNNYSFANQHYNKALKITETQWTDHRSHPEKGAALFNKAKAIYPESYDDHLLELLDESISHFKVEGNNQQYVINRVFLEMLEFKGKVLNKLSHKNQKYLMASDKNYQLAMTSLNNLRRNFLDENSKILISEKAIPIYEEALSAQFQMYKLNPSKGRKDSIFQLLENSKALSLLESINEISAKGLGGIPDSLLVQEKNIKLDIAYINTVLAETSNTEKQKIQMLENSLFDLENKHRDLVKRYELEYPAYYELKFRDKISSIDEVQNHLADNNSILVEYFVGTDRIYIFEIDKNDSYFHEVPRWDSFEDDINLLQTIISHFPNASNAKRDFESFAKTSHQVYDKLIEPLHLRDSASSLIIIPDDILSTLPFDILIENEPTIFSYGLDNMEYLLDGYSISYNYSSSIMLSEPFNLNKNKSYKYEYLGFAPSFGNNENALSLRKCNSNELSKLACNKEEVERIEALIGGDFLIEDKATLKAFDLNYNNTKILHLATHTCLNDENPMDNKIFFQDGFLSNYDLYNLELSNELTVLSACQTGSGVLKKGEGVMSLTRGFVHAGCPSVLMSLWPVEDCSTSKLMELYYNNLSNGSKKDQALQMAKKEYLKHANKLQSHPFFWAPFVQFGNTEPISQAIGQSSFEILPVVIIISLVLLLLFIMIKLRKRTIQG